MPNNTLTNKEDWDAGYKDFHFSAMPENYPIVEKIYNNFKKTTTGEVFEIGCFPGRFLYHFGKLGYKLSGVDQTDYLDKMVDWLKKNNFRIGTFIKGDIFKVNSDKKYDVVFSSGFIEHFTNFEEMIYIHKKFVKDNGYVFITTPNFANFLQKKLHTWLDKENLERHYLPAMNPEKWKSILVKKGFKIIAAGYTGGLDFWVGNQKRSLGQTIIIKIMLRFLPMRWLPNHRSYSPEIYIIAQKHENFN